MQNDGARRIHEPIIKYKEKRIIVWPAPNPHFWYSLRPKNNDVLGFKICPKKNDVLLNLACVHVHVGMQQSIST
jgi:hypothetical protein